MLAAAQHIESAATVVVQRAGRHGRAQLRGHEGLQRLHDKVQQVHDGGGVTIVTSVEVALGAGLIGTQGMSPWLQVVRNHSVQHRHAPVLVVGWVVCKQVHARGAPAQCPPLLLTHVAHVDALPSPMSEHAHWITTCAA